MIMQNVILRKALIAGIVVFLVGTNVVFVSEASVENDTRSNSMNAFSHDNPEVYTITTWDNASITLTRYVGTKHPSVMFIHGMGCNHKIYDFDQNHSLARFLNKDGWDVWMLDLRTHDGDGDYFFVKGSTREYIDRSWDFDNTYLRIDVVTAIAFIKNKTGEPKIFLSGHSLGGYLAYAYAEVVGQEDLAGIITTGAAPYGMTMDVFMKFTSRHPLLYLSKYGFFLGEKAYLNPCGYPCSFSYPKILLDVYMRKYQPNILVFDNYTTPAYVQQKLAYCGDNEPAGVVVDMFFGKYPGKYQGDWVDPQTLYDYSANLTKITVPILFIAGGSDPQDPSTDMYRGYENVSSDIKELHSFPHHSHLDLLLGDDASTLIFPVIDTWMNSQVSTKGSPL
jgi:pimeloyl-ACP methyl ester carboxylesterase